MAVKVIITCCVLVTVIVAVGNWLFNIVVVAVITAVSVRLGIGV